MRKMLLTLITLSMLLLTACQTQPQTDHVQRLLKHPQFPAASKSGPEFVKDALHTINDLQLELARERSK